MRRTVLMLELGVVGSALALTLLARPAAPNAAQATPQQADAAPVVSSAPATKLRVRLGNADAADAVLDPSAKGWETAAPTQVLLNRTPRVYQTEKLGPTEPSTLEVRGLRAGKQVVFRLAWKDATRNAPEAPPRKEGEGGDPAKLYKRPTGQTTAFADAAAVMVPEAWKGGEFPSLVMGDERSPVRLYYWNATRGAEQLTARGRAHVEGPGKAFRHQASHADGQWTLTLELPELPTPSPIAFAVWDGEASDRDGLKMFSIWYALE